MGEGVRLEVDVIKAVQARIPPSFIRDVMQKAATLPEVEARLPAGPATVAVRLTGDRELRRLNYRYAGEDRSTDVLSFAGEHPHLGDLAISLPAVARQARQHGHSAQTELALLNVHGLLHLLGGDHATAAERREMTRLTVAARSLSGLRVAKGRL